MAAAWNQFTIFLNSHKKEIGVNPDIVTSWTKLSEVYITIKFLMAIIC